MHLPDYDAHALLDAFADLAHVPEAGCRPLVESPSHLVEEIRAAVVRDDGDVVAYAFVADPVSYLTVMTKAEGRFETSQVAGSPSVSTP